MSRVPTRPAPPRILSRRAPLSAAASRADRSLSFSHALAPYWRTQGRRVIGAGTVSFALEHLPSGGSGGGSSSPVARRASSPRIGPNVSLRSGPSSSFDALAPSCTPMLDQHLAFSKYRLLARLGSGGMADVFLAVSGHGAGGFNKLLVLKVLRPDLPATERAEFFRMFQDEGRLAMRLSHPTIVQAYEVGSEDAFSFIAMEYLEGQPLSAIQERAWKAVPGVSPELQIHVLCQVLEGLEYAHALTDYSGRRLNIVHRDVSPQNVFVTYSGHTKLVDFGIAKTLESNSKTAAGVVKGKIPYMSPEQVRCGSVDHRADLFSVGVMLWEAVARRNMHGSASLYEILQRLVSGDLPRLRDVVPDVHPDLDRIAMRALSREPERRYPDAAALRDELLTFLDGRRKVSSRELGERVAQLFEPERQAINEVIRLAMSDVVPDDDSEPLVEGHAGGSMALEGRHEETGRVTVPTVPPRELSIAPSSAPVVLPLEAVEVSTDTPSVAPARQSAVGSAALGPTAAVRAPKLTRRGVALGIVGGGLALAVTLLIALRGPLTPGPQAPEPVVSGVGREAIEPRATVRLSLSAQPESAVFTLDGQPLEGNPHRGERALDFGPHALVVSALGHEPRRLEIRLDRDVDLEVRLAEAVVAREPPAAPAPSATAGAFTDDGAEEVGGADEETAAVDGRAGARRETRRRRRASATQSARSDDEMYPDLPAVPAPLESAERAAPSTSENDEELYPDLPVTRPRAAPRLDTSERPW